MFDDAEIRGTVVWRGDEGFQEALDALVWNAMKPARKPAVIVHALDEADVCAAVRLAEAQGLKVKVRSGGHSWTASSVRENAMLIDMGKLNGIEVDVAAKTAVIGTAAKVKQVVGALAEHGLFFPAGHCPSVGIGGFLLQGGWGWNSRALGVACTNVFAVDVVTASGELIHATSTENAEYFWGARGAGSGYYGIVTRFHVTLFDPPKTILHRQEIYPADCGEAVLKWAFTLQDQLPAEIEWFVFCSRPSQDEPAQYRVEAISFMADEAEARRVLSIFDQCPVRDQALKSAPVEPTNMTDLLAGTDSLYVEGYRWAGDNAWFDDTPDALAAAMVRAANVLPPWPSHLVVYGWPEIPAQDALFSMAGRLYACAISGWNDPAEDDHQKRASARSMAQIESFSKGTGLADEGLLYRDAPIHTAETRQRLEKVRADADPASRFLGYLRQDGV